MIGWWVILGLLIVVTLAYYFLCTKKKGGAVINKNFENDIDNVFHEQTTVATQLDLARAYIDMGDQAGAKEILKTILHKENTVDQKEEVKKLLAGCDKKTSL